MQNAKFFVLAILFLTSYTLNSQTTFAKVSKSTSLKSSASSDARTIARLSPEDEFVYLNDCNQYYCKVEFNGKSGWVKKQLIEQLENQVQDVVNSSDAMQNSEVEEKQTEIPIPEKSKEESTTTDLSSDSGSSFFIFIPIFFLLSLGFLIWFCSYLWKKNKILKQEVLDAENNSKAAVQQVLDIEKKYSGITNVDDEINRRKSDFETVEKNLQENIEKLRTNRKELKQKYSAASQLFQKLTHENKLLEDNLDIAEFGVYEPQFDFETSAIFKLKIKEIKEKQKDLIKKDQAVSGGENMSYNGSVAQGKSMVKRQKKLMLRAFNGECDNFISAVKWNTVTRAEERILKAAETISKTGETQGLKIESAYARLKLIELKMYHEQRLKMQEEREIQAQIREQIREEEKARKEFEKAQKESQKEEEYLQKALKHAQDKYAKASEAERSVYELQLAELQLKLTTAEEKNQRAISMAQQTRAGHVYVISNIGSFGENIFKIGMTRRLEPLDRVYELGSASVPFRFDVHAMIYSVDAPDLESKLHREFDKYRLNHVNRRREYFNVSLQEIERVVKANHGEIEFIIEPEAQEYRESLVIAERALAGHSKTDNGNEVAFLSEIFD